MILTAPDDRRFQNGPAFRKGDPVDVAELADALGRTDVDELAADLLDQGWPEAKPAKAKAAKKAASKKLSVTIKGSATKTDPASAGDDTAPEGADTKEP